MKYFELQNVEFCLITHCLWSMVRLEIASLHVTMKFALHTKHRKMDIEQEKCFHIFVCYSLS